MIRKVRMRVWLESNVFYGTLFAKTDDVAAAGQISDGLHTWEYVKNMGSCGWSSVYVPSYTTGM